MLRPEDVDFNFARAFLQLATELDDDPFVDFAYGYVTGRTADDALAFVEAGIRASKKKVEPKVASLAGGVDRSAQYAVPYRLRTKSVKGLRALVAGEKAFPEEGHDRAFVREVLPEFEDYNAVTFIGHGWPGEVVGGIDYRDLRDARFEGAVFLNVACYTGVTQRYFQDDWRAGQVREKSIELDESFGLTLLRTGVVGYTAYTCPRPAGPELDTDLVSLIAGGASLGEARRRDYDKTVLGFLGFGVPRLDLPLLVDGQKFSRQRDAVRDIMLEAATGGIVFGDPALRPFRARPEEAPVRIEVEAARDRFDVRATCPGHALFLQCSDQTARFGDTMAMRVYARVPLGGALVRDVTVTSLELGGVPQKARLIWAFERDADETYAQVKVMFPRPRMPGPIEARVEIVTTRDAAEAKASGGDAATTVERSPAPNDPSSTAILPIMLEVAPRYDVSREALQAALDATAAELARPGAANSELRALTRFESEGFRALCVLLEVGHHHYRTAELLAATYRPGDERHLLALARKADLPNYASWSVRDGLGVADTDEVCAFLLEELRTSEDAGEFMSAAQGLARVGEKRAVRPIGRRLVEFRTGWSGVEPHLLSALGKLGGAGAVRVLERYALDERATNTALALSLLKKLDPAVHRRIAARLEKKKRD